MFEAEKYFSFGHRKAFIGKHDFCFHRTLNKHFCYFFHVCFGSKGGHVKCWKISCSRFIVGRHVVFISTYALAFSKVQMHVPGGKKGFKYSHQPQTRASTRNLFYKNKLSTFKNLKSSPFQASIRFT